MQNNGGFGEFFGQQDSFDFVETNPTEAILRIARGLLKKSPSKLRKKDEKLSQNITVSDVAMGLRDQNTTQGRGPLTVTITSVSKRRILDDIFKFKTRKESLLRTLTEFRTCDIPQFTAWAQKALHTELSKKNKVRDELDQTHQKIFEIRSQKESHQGSGEFFGFQTFSSSSDSESVWTNSNMNEDEVWATEFSAWLSSVVPPLEASLLLAQGQIADFLVALEKEGFLLVSSSRTFESEMKFLEKFVTESFRERLGQTDSNETLAIFSEKHSVQVLFKKIARLIHPDKNPHQTPELQNLWLELQKSKNEPKILKQIEAKVALELNSGVDSLPVSILEEIRESYSLEVKEIQKQLRRAREQIEFGFSKRTPKDRELLKKKLKLKSHQEMLELKSLLKTAKIELRKIQTKENKISLPGIA